MRAVWIERLQEGLLKPAVPSEGAGQGELAPACWPGASALRARSNRNGLRVAGSEDLGEYTEWE